MRFIELEDSEKEELVRRYANHKNATVRKRVQALILSSQYYSMKEIIEATGMSRTTLYRFFKEWENTELSEGDFYKLKFCHSDIYMYICIVKQE